MRDKMKKIVAMTMAGALAIAASGITGSNTAYAESGSFGTHYYSVGSRISKYTASASTDSDQSATVSVKMSVVKRNKYTRAEVLTEYKMKTATAHVYSAVGCNKGNEVMKSVFTKHTIKVPGVKAKKLHTSASR